MKTEPEFVQQIVDMYSSGKNQKEIVETIGQTYCVVRYWLKKKGVFKAERFEKGQTLKREALEDLSLRLLSQGLGYIGGYEHKKSYVTITCFICGNSFERNASEVKRHPTECPFCKKAEKEKQKAEEKVRRIAEGERKNREQSEYWKKYREQKELERQAEKERIWNESHVCPICNKTFSIKEYAESIGADPMFIPAVEYCSKKCKRKAHKSSDHIKRAKHHGCEWERGITWHSAVKRLGLRCAICGEMCDPNDTSYGNGSGPLYPTIDHIVPIAKGGAHKWENVQIAHHLCNSLKNDKIV